uniref:Uncharacterized protein n=1 Tax=Myoviridae sp. cta6i12 TaxID=2827695 RepID=A0A8S5T7R9_9CAUD|nr:MAG TPA: hypothetical protein [Myoviridae sp. cta6i12]
MPADRCRVLWAITAKKSEVLFKSDSQAIEKVMKNLALFFSQIAHGAITI